MYFVTLFALGFSNRNSITQATVDKLKLFLTEIQYSMFKEFTSIDACIGYTAVASNKRTPDFLKIGQIRLLWANPLSGIYASFAFKGAVVE